MNSSQEPSAASPRVSAPVRETPFDELAASYDRDFSQNPVGRLMRQAVWRRLDARFQPGQRILELNCGTGEDAVYLARLGLRVTATDKSRKMAEFTHRKVSRHGLADKVQVRQLSLEEMERLEAVAFDGALSNMGGLNCVGDLGVVARGLASLLRPGAMALLCIMGPVAPWEWAWFWHRGERQRMFRRLEKGGTEWRGLRIRYPSIGRARRAFAEFFRLRRVSGIGFLMPPPYAKKWMQGPGRLQRLFRWERRLEALPPFPWLSDHYLLELQRR